MWPRRELMAMSVVLPASLQLLHDNVRKFGTVFNTIVPGTQLSGVPRRKQE